MDLFTKCLIAYGSVTFVLQILSIDYVTTETKIKDSQNSYFISLSANITSVIFVLATFLYIFDRMI